jgi:hypothetical protein
MAATIKRNRDRLLVDAFYAACEQVRLGADPKKPLVVQQWESLIAVNYVWAAVRNLKLILTSAF